LREHQNKHHPERNEKRNSVFHLRSFGVCHSTTNQQKLETIPPSPPLTRDHYEDFR
jgi:hypothetical protein